MGEITGAMTMTTATSITTKPEPATATVRAASTVRTMTVVSGDHAGHRPSRRTLRGRGPRGGPALADGDEICAVLFASLRRSDQRQRARHYLSGLLEAQGRKTIRNIAALTDGAPGEQSLHHFISDSTWDWAPIRAALADHVARVLRPRAWVVRPLFIPKAGEHSVGVGRQPAPDGGPALNGQLAYGTWASSEETSVPVQWRLHLPDPWLADAGRRHRAEIPDSAAAETPDECAAVAALSVVGRVEGPPRPVVLDVPVTDLAASVRRFTAARVPLVVRIGAHDRVAVDDRALPGHRSGTVPARRLMESVRHLRRPVESGAGPGRLAAALRVRLPGPGAGPELLLVGEWRPGGRAPAALWLAAPATASARDVLRSARCAGRAELDERQTGERVGVRDFEGRSFRGWHRHMTLASVAHAVTALDGADGPPTGGGLLSA